MNLSVPIYSLKRRAKSVSRQENIPLHSALDKVAKTEGFDNWSLLAARTKSSFSAAEMMGLFTSGEIVLLGARPGHGKTLLGVDLVANSTNTGKHGWFFTLEWNQADVEECLEQWLCSRRQGVQFSLKLQKALVKPYPIGFRTKD